MIIMTSHPTISQLAVPPSLAGKRVHRHRRSAAISGDFDVSDLGILSPPRYRHSSTSSNPQISLSPSSLHQRLYLSLFAVRSSHSRIGSLDDSVLDKHFQFSNKDDFTNKPESEKFHFPSGPATPNDPPSTPKLNPASPRGFPSNFSNLNSPIHLRNKKSGSMSAANTPRMFLTEETVFDSHNIPNAVIDLDEILIASNKPENDEKYTDCRSKDFVEFPSSPRIIKADCALPSSPYSVLAFLKQPLREFVSDPIEEEEDFEDAKLPEDITLTETQEASLSRGGTPNLSELEVFLNPQETFHGVYQLQSASSSTSSIPSSSFIAQRNFSATLIEKTPSNSSKDSGTSFIFTNTGTPTSKRSSAKAARYQSFYDQSFRISSALKNSSNDSIHLISTLNEPSLIKDDARSLGHSSSFPSLKNNLKRPVPLRLNEVRGKRDAGHNSPPFPPTHRVAPPPEVPFKSMPNEPSVFLSPAKLSVSEGSSQMKAKNATGSPITKVTLHSPSSLVSGFSSTGDTIDDALTDHSSVLSNVENTLLENELSIHKRSMVASPIYEKRYSNSTVLLPLGLIPPVKVSETISVKTVVDANKGQKVITPSRRESVPSPFQHAARSPRKSLSSYRTATPKKGNNLEVSSDQHEKKNSRRKSEIFSNWFRRSRS